MSHRTGLGFLTYETSRAPSALSLVVQVPFELKGDKWVVVVVVGGVWEKKKKKSTQVSLHFCYLYVALHLDGGGRL